MLGLGNILTKGGALLGFPNKYSFNFDGSNDYLETEKISLDFTNISISMWINADSFSGDDIFFAIADADSNDEELILFNDNSDSNKFSVFFPQGSSENVSSGTIPTGSWTHLALTKSGTALKMYVNGSEVFSGSYTNTNTYSRNIIIGVRKTSSYTQYFNGKIDEVSIWDSALDATAIGKISSKVVDLTKYSASNLKLWLRAGDKVLPEEDASIARSDFYTDFDGTNDYVDCGDGSGLGFSGAEAFSLTAWVNPSSLSSAQIINAFGSDTSSSPEGKRTSLFINSSAKPGLAFWGNDVISDGTVSTNKWVHLVTTFAGGNRTSANTKIYIDGVSQTLTGGTASALDLSDMDFFHIGADQNESQVCNGIISNTSIYKTVLDAQTIKQFAKSRYTPMRDNRFSAVSFDGSNDYIDCGNDSSLELAGDMTITAWINPTGADSSQGIVTKRDGGGTNYYFALDSSTPPKLTLYDGSGSGTSTGTITKDSWQHIAISIDSGVTNGSIFYINGIASGTATLTITANDAPLVIGRRLSDNYYEGSISSASVYNTAKSAEEVYALYSKGITYNESSESGLVGLWRMGDDTSASYPTIADSSSNSNDGTASGAVEAQQMISGYDMGAFESSSEELGGNSFENESFETWDDADTINWWTHKDVNNNSGSGLISQVGSGETTGGSGTGSVNFFASTSSNMSLTTPQNILKNNTFYKFVADVSRFEAGILRLSLATNATVNLTSADVVNNQIVYYFVSGGSNYHYLRLSGSGVCDFTLDSVSLKEVLQSELSDTYPAIIDVNEPVLGVELFTNGWTNDGNGSSYPPYSGSFSYDASANTVTATSGSSGTYVTNETFRTEFTAVANAFYKITFTTANTNPTIQIRGLSSVNHLDTGTSTPYLSLTYSLSVDGEQVFYVKANASATRYIGFRSGGNNRSITVSNFSIKQVSGNVGLMTNQATSDLVYSSVLPDQSFLTGVNSAYNFIDLDGADQYIDCGDGTSLDTTSQLTLSSWVNFDSTGTNVILARDDNTNSNYILYGWSDGKIYAQIQISGVGKTVDGGSYSSDTWYHVVVTFDGSSLKIYVDADLKDTLSASGSIDNDDVSLEIGRKGNNAFHFDGQIGQTAIWNKSLSSTEVGAIYNLGRHGNLLDSYSDNLVGNWAMSSLDSATGLSDSISTVYDRSGNSNHGTPTNADAGDLKSPPNAEPNGYAKGDTNRSTTTP